MFSKKSYKMFILYFAFVLLISIILNTNAVFASDSSNEIEFILKWGSYGTSAGEFKYPHSVAVDKYNNIYIADLKNDRIQKFDNNGNYILEWGQHGSLVGELYYPSCIAYDGDEKIYVVEQYNSRVQIFDLNGNYINHWSIPRNSSGIAIDSMQGYVYIANSDNNQIIKYTTSGEIVASWGDTTTDTNALKEPRGLVLDNKGYLYVADCWNNRIVKYSTDGTFIKSWGEYGNGNNQFIWPCYLTINDNDIIFVVDWGNRCVKYFDLDGDYIGQFGSSGNLDGQFNNPNGISIDNNGSIIVADTDNHRVQKFGYNKPPVISIIQPKQDSVLPKGTAIEFSVYDDNDGENCQYTALLISQDESISINSGFIPDAGIYNLSIEATDSSGKTSLASIDFVIYDPKSNFITGGGWINSPIEANNMDCKLSDKATFGFSSKYLKNNNLPTGHFEFFLKEIDLHFYSTQLEWLIVSDTKAYLKGNGTINGSENYEFLLTCIDGQMIGKDANDYFYLKIWDASTQEIIYINYSDETNGSSLDCSACIVYGGNITIHNNP